MSAPTLNWDALLVRVGFSRDGSNAHGKNYMHWPSHTRAYVGYSKPNEALLRTAIAAVTGARPEDIPDAPLDMNVPGLDVPHDE